MNSEILKQSIEDGIQIGQTIAYNAIWKVIEDFLVDHLIITLVILVMIFIIATIRSFFGNWDMLGKFLYWFLFLGSLFAIAMIFGPGIFASNYVKIFTLILGGIVYFAVGRMLDWTGLRRSY